jgi:hypothetical protein
MRIGLSITKSTLFRGVQQEFSNVYHFELETAVTAPGQELVDEVTAFEKSFHGNSVNFLRGNVWSAGGSAGQNHMLHQQTLGGVGGQSAADIDRERAVLVQWPAGFDSRGRPVYMRKWYHNLSVAFGGVNINSAGFLSQTQAFTDAQRDQIGAKVAEVENIGSLPSWQLCSKSGRDFTGPPRAHKWLEHHQLGDMWR